MSEKTKRPPSRASTNHRDAVLSGASLLARSAVGAAAHRHLRGEGASRPQLHRRRRGGTGVRGAPQARVRRPGHQLNVGAREGRVLPDVPAKDCQITCPICQNAPNRTIDLVGFFLVAGAGFEPATFRL